MSADCPHGMPPADCDICWKSELGLLGDTCAFGTCVERGVRRVASTHEGRIADWRLMCEAHVALSVAHLGAITSPADETNPPNGAAS